MISRRLLTIPIGAAATLCAAGVAAAPVGASENWGLNGAYTATSNGEWAKTNDRFRDEASLRSTWTISTQCSYPTECTGTVRSDFGWTEPIYKTGGVWYVKHEVPDWQPCPDGRRFNGLQVFRFVGTTPDGSRVDPSSTMLLGEDETTGQPGACGVGNPLVITMPFKLVKAT